MEDIKKRMDEIEKNEGFTLVEDKSRVTTKVFLSYDIVGFITTDDNGNLAVNVIKNEMNNVTGIIPFSLWMSLVEDKMAINEKQRFSQERGVMWDFDEVFTDLSKTFSKTFDDVLSNVEETVDRIKPEVSKSLEKIINEVSDTVQEKAQELKRDRLIALWQEAEKLGVQTKGLNKKIQNKINSINKTLG